MWQIKSNYQKAKSRKIQYVEKKSQRQKENFAETSDLAPNWATLQIPQIKLRGENLQQQQQQLVTAVKLGIFK